MLVPSGARPLFLAPCVLALAASAAHAADGDALTLGVALAGSLSAGQAVPEGYDNSDGNDRSSTSVPAIGFGGGAAFVGRQPLTGRSQLRFGARVGYGQGRALFDVATTCEGADGCVTRGALRGSAAFGAAVVGGEAHLGDNTTTRPYLLGELGFGAAQLWPRAVANENNELTCAVSKFCAEPGEDPAGEEAAPPGRETARVAVGPMTVVGLGLAFPDVPLRVEGAYVWHSLLGGPWNVSNAPNVKEADSPGTSLSRIEVSIGYLFGG